MNINNPNEDNIQEEAAKIYKLLLDCSLKLKDTDEHYKTNTPSYDMKARSAQVELYKNLAEGSFSIEALVMIISQTSPASLHKNIRYIDLLIKRYEEESPDPENPAIEILQAIKASSVQYAKDPHNEKNCRKVVTDLSKRIYRLKFSSLDLFNILVALANRINPKILSASVLASVKNETKIDLSKL